MTARRAKLLLDRRRVWGKFAVQSNQWKDPRLTGHAAEFSNRLEMEVEGEQFRIEEEQVRAKRQIKPAIGKRQRRQGPGDIPSSGQARGIIRNERSHHRLPALAEGVKVAVKTPHVILRIRAHLRKHWLKTALELALEFRRAVRVHRIAGDDRKSAPRHLGVEARRAVAAAENLSAQVRLGEVEHPLIFPHRATPRDDLVQSHLW